MRVAISSEMLTEIHHVPGISPSLPADFWKMITRIGEKKHMCQKYQNLKFLNVEQYALEYRDPQL
jgi:hypothetical protein